MCWKINPENIFRGIVMFALVIFHYAAQISPSSFFQDSEKVYLFIYFLFFLVSCIKLEKISILHNDVSATPNHRLLNMYISRSFIIDPMSNVLRTGETNYYCCHSMKFNVETKVYHEK